METESVVRSLELPPRVSSDFVCSVGSSFSFLFFFSSPPPPRVLYVKNSLPLFSSFPSTLFSARNEIARSRSFRRFSTSNWPLLCGRTSRSVFIYVPDATASPSSLCNRIRGHSLEPAKSISRSLVSRRCGGGFRVARAILRFPSQPSPVEYERTFIATGSHHDSWHSIRRYREHSTPRDIYNERRASTL